MISEWKRQAVDGLLTPPPSERGISVEGASILARQLRDAVEAQDIISAGAAFGTHCPLDLHALAPVPNALLQLGPDDPAAIAWLWGNWGTTWPLRGVEELEDEQLPEQADARLEQHRVIAFAGDGPRLLHVAALAHVPAELRLAVEPFGDLVNPVQFGQTRHQNLVRLLGLSRLFRTCRHYLMRMPVPTRLSVRIVACCLSTVTV